MLKYFLKPLPVFTCLLLILLRSELDLYAILIAAGLEVSILGDIFLINEKRYFLQGLIAFFVAHLCYLAAFSLEAEWTAQSLFPLLGIAVFAVLVFIKIRQRLKSLKGPVILYMMVLALMVWQGLLKENVWLTVGALSFMLSDTFLALHRFHKPIPYRMFWILSSYYLGQVGIALSVFN